MISVEKPGSPSEILEHHGVKGQRWGVQKAVTKSGAFKRWSKTSNANVQRHYARKTARRERKEARAPTKGIAPTRSSREFRAKYPTGKLQAKAIREARVGVRQRTKAIRKEKDSVEKARLLRDHRNHPGTPIALRTTRGEKVVDALLLGFVPKEGIAGDVAAISVGATIGVAGARRSIERKQRRGGYK